MFSTLVFTDGDRFGPGAGRSVYFFGYDIAFIINAASFLNLGIGRGLIPGQSGKREAEERRRRKEEEKRKRKRECFV